MKSKYINKLCFIKDNFYHNKRDKSPYIIIINVDKKGTRYYIDYINRYGKFDMVNTKDFYYTKLEILEYEDHEHLLYQIIRGQFEK